MAEGASYGGTDCQDKQGKTRGDSEDPKSRKPGLNPSAPVGEPTGRGTTVPMAEGASQGGADCKAEDNENREDSEEVAKNSASRWFDSKATYKASAAALDGDADNSSKELSAEVQVWRAVRDKGMADALAQQIPNAEGPTQEKVEQLPGTLWEWYRLPLLATG